jgi:Fe-S-cluster-containing dehydrogenase component
MVPAKTRITVRKTGENEYIPLLCLQCEDPACVKVCFTAALSKREESGTVEFDSAKCVSCRMCVVACPFGSIEVSVDDGKIQKCDLCGGDPMCAKFCPSGALISR